jgi:hypothetical protein
MHARRWTWYFLFSALHLVLAGWTFAGPPVVGNWAAGLITMINQFKQGNGAPDPSASLPPCKHNFFTCCLLTGMHACICSCIEPLLDLLEREAAG